MKIDLQKTMMPTISLAVILVMAIIIAVVSYTTNSQNRAASYKIIKNSFFVFSDLIDKKKRDLIAYSRQLANTEAIALRFQLINDDQYQPESSVLDLFYYEMLNQLLLIGLTNKNINKVTLYNNDGRLMAFYHFYDNVIDIGAYQHSRKHYIVARVESGKPLTENLFIEQSTLTGFATHYENPISDKEIIRFDEEGQQLALVSLIPMFGKTLQIQDNEWITVREQVGILKAISFIEPEFIQRTAMLSGTQMNVSMKSGESFGTLNNYPQFDFSKFPEKNENWSIENETVLFDEIQIAEDDYFLGTIPVYSDSGIVAVINSLYTQEIARSNTFQMLRILGVVFGVSIILLIPIIYLFRLIGKRDQTIQEQNERLKLLTMNILETSAQERKRISEEIHDTLTQTLTTIHYRLQACDLMLQDSQSFHNEVKWLNTKVQEAIQQSRKVISVLHPDVIDNIGLNSALENYFEVFSANTGIQVISQVEDGLSMASNVTLALYRIIREALTNISKHSNATEIELDLGFDEKELVLSIRDNGSGSESDPEMLVSPEKGRFGLFYMQQRIDSFKGQMNISTRLNQGFHIHIAMPIEEVRNGSSS